MRVENTGDRPNTPAPARSTAPFPMIKKSLLGFVGLFLAYAASRPVEFHVERSATLPASPAARYEQVNDHRKFDVWNPSLKLDPNVKNVYGGPVSGVGATCSWDGNSDIGAGSATIVESKPGELVRMRMEWKRPMEGTSTVDFTFRPVGDKTGVTWAMYDRKNFLGKVVSVFIDSDKMGGPSFEQGLADLGKVAATAPASPGPY